MPSTTRYSATFDRPYEEDERALSNASSNGMRRSRSQSWQANLGMDGRPYSPFANNRFSQRSSSTDSSATKSLETIPTRTLSKPPVKTHNNPFQFVKIGTSPLYKKAEEQLKKTKEVKKVDVLKEEEEEWQSNLDSWKSRRRKMSEDVFRRQEEIKQLELEQQQQDLEAAQKKIKTFSEMVESRAHRGRALSCCLISSPLDLQKWDLENNNSKTNGSHSYSEGSEENSVVNSEDEGIGVKGNLMNKKSQSTENILSNSSASSRNQYFELGNNCMSPNNGNYFDSGLESISSSHRAGDTPDSCSDFSQDSGSGIDCDSPRASGLSLNGVNLLDKFNSKEFHANGDISAKENEENCCKQNGIGCVNGTSQIIQMNQNQAKSGDSLKKQNLSSINSLGKSQITHEKQDRSIESENEVFVDDFEDINKSTKLNFINPKQQSKSAVSASLKEDQRNDIVHNKLVSHNGLLTMKVATVVQTSEDASDELSDLQENKYITSTPSSLSCDSESYISDDLSLTKTITSTDDDNTNIIVKLKKSKRKNAKKKKDIKSINENRADQKSNIPVSDEGLSIVYQSPTACKERDKSESQVKEKVVLKDVPPVEQVAEEMERLILQQLEEEERAKEMSMKVSPDSILESPEHNTAFRSRSAEPPKEKPPPPPSGENDTNKSSSLKRVNSTKRIKKEICKRRSNFLGIENEEPMCDELTIPPPPALEQILKAEMELDRESRRKLESATTERLILEENEIRKKEQEIIDVMETEERQKQMIINCDEFSDVKSDCTEVCDSIHEGDRIEFLKEERKRMEKERILTEEQRLRLMEEKQLKEREELIKKQEADKTTTDELSAPLSNTAKLANASNIISLSSSDSKLNKSNQYINGDGENITSDSVANNQAESEVLEKSNCSPKPAVPPKPLKKKEAIRKERERLRQEQEALVREREEHRRKLKEEEEMLKSQHNSHAPDGHVSRIGPLPSLIKPAFVPKLTSPISAQPSAKENTVANRNFYATQNSISKNSNYVESPSHNTNKRNKPIPPPKKTVKSELRGQQKLASVRKQTHEPATESKYNQNHWLIQEAEMRRITELKERQRASQFSNPQTHLAEDDVCSVPTRAHVLPPSLHLNNPVKEQIWNYGHPPMAMKKYPPAVSSERPIAYARDNPPAKPSRIVPLERSEQILSVSGRKRCSHCNEELGEALDSVTQKPRRGAAMIIESLQLYYHIHCFQCCVCEAQLGNGSCGTDVRVRNNKLHCHNCYSNDEAGLKFSQV